VNADTSAEGVPSTSKKAKGEDIAAEAPQEALVEDVTQIPIEGSN